MKLKSSLLVLAFISSVIYCQSQNETKKTIPHPPEAKSAKQKFTPPPPPQPPKIERELFAPPPPPPPKPRKVI